MGFVPVHTDFSRSPYTGLTRESWIEAAKYMLEGIFQHVAAMDSPVVVPRQETQITYPHSNSSKERYEAECRAEIFEGLTRSLLIAAPLIHCEPEVEICGFPLRDYYKRQILCSCTSGDAHFVGTYEDLQSIVGGADPFRTFQQTVESSTLAIGLWVCREQIWDTYTQEERDLIAAFLSSFAHGSTVPQNWRLFNMLDLAFLHMEGYPIDEEIMIDHANAIAEYYAGDGWYRDGQSFDYYSCWAFNFYAPLWCKWYGYEKLPHLAEKFEACSNRLMATYPDFFDREGWTNMWGRSNIYRFASVTAFDGNFLLDHPTANPGLARRISSGSLLQFLQRDDFRWKGIPTLGFYKQFKPSIQGYSCAESTFWMGKIFLALHLPEEHPFWTAREENGTWELLKKNQVKETVLNGPGLLFSNHEANGDTILRTGKVVKQRNDLHGMWHYSKLSYHTKYPWEATPRISQGPFVTGDVESQQYVLLDQVGKYRSLCNITLWGGARDHVLYRRQYFDYRLDTETHWMQSLHLADFTVPYGIMRVDKAKLIRRPAVLTLGSYGFPDQGTQIRRYQQDGGKAIVLTGTDACGRNRRMAMTVYGGWDQLEVLHSIDTNPDSDKSLVIYAFAERKKHYGAYEPCVFISQILTREDGGEFAMDDLFPIREIVYQDAAKCGAYGPIEIHLYDGTVRTIDYQEIEGHLSL